MELVVQILSGQNCSVVIDIIWYRSRADSVRLDPVTLLISSCAWLCSQNVLTKGPLKFHPHFNFSFAISLNPFVSSSTMLQD